MDAQRGDEQRPEMIRGNVLRPDLNHARTARAAVRQENAEVQVVGENDVLVVPRLLHDLGIGGVVSANGRPVDCLKAALAEIRHPFGRQVHVQEELHAAARGTSNSSTRQAA